MWSRVVRLYVVARSRLEEFAAEEGSGEKGQSMVEYAIMAALIAVVPMAAVQALGTGVSQVFERIVGHIQGIGV